MQRSERMGFDRLVRINRMNLPLTRVCILWFL
jgi:hypothetical protein